MISTAHPLGAVAAVALWVRSLRFCSRIKGLINGFIPAGNPAAGPSRTTDPHSTAALDVLESTQKTQFCPEAEEHEEMLREIWRLLVPGKPFQRISRAWGDVGFQVRPVPAPARPAHVAPTRTRGLCGLRSPWPARRAAGRVFGLALPRTACSL